MRTIRRSNERGHVNFGWLDSHHTFSFGSYYDPEYMGFRSLRVINEDRVTPAQGFGTHGHRNMEIISYVLDGKLGHKDSMGNGSTIVPGEVQLMSAGAGVTHSEMNPSKTDGVHFLQIWILPDRENSTPRYEQKAFAPEERQGQLRLLVSPDGADGSLTIFQDARLYGTLLADGDEVTHSIPDGRHAWVHVAKGAVDVDGTTLKAGDALAVSDEDALTLTGTGDAEVLVFDLA